MAQQYNFQPTRRVYRKPNGQEYAPQEFAISDLRKKLAGGINTTNKKLDALSEDERLKLQNAMARANDFHSLGDGYYSAFLKGCKVAGIEPTRIEAYFTGTTSQQIMTGVTRLFDIYLGKLDNSEWEGFLKTSEWEAIKRRKQNTDLSTLPLFNQAQKTRREVSDKGILELMLELDAERTNVLTEEQAEFFAQNSDIPTDLAPYINTKVA